MCWHGDCRQQLESAMPAFHGVRLQGYMYHKQCRACNSGCLSADFSSAAPSAKAAALTREVGGAADAVQVPRADALHLE